VILTGRSSTEDVCTSILAGARGYILRDEGIDEIAAGIRAAARGEAMLSPRATAALIDEYRRLADGHGVAAVESQKLTKRELEVLRLVTEGRDNREIATRLQISVSTVKSHVSKLLEELGVENRIQAAVEATRRHLV
jgi:DNA-binding NarL/FixJ family response regulator